MGNRKETHVREIDLDDPLDGTFRGHIRPGVN
jgi:hypothetical protein